MFEVDSATPTQKIESDFLEKHCITLFLKRDDLIDPEISGNKWRKLKYNFLHAQELNHRSILTFGGAYSNHIAATATAANKYGFKSFGIIRGEELDPNSNLTLKRAHDLGMNLKFISRTEYSQRTEEDYINSLQIKYGSCYVIPEGGSNSLAIRGCAEIVQEINHGFDVIVTSVGTGGTLAGLASSIKPDQQALGICVLKGSNYLDEIVKTLVRDYSNSDLDNWRINHDHHLGGYAKYNDHLIEFINQFKSENNILLDPVYTGKMMLAIYTLIKEGYFEPETSIVALHTGGLQGIKGFNAANTLRIKI